MDRQTIMSRLEDLVRAPGFVIDLCVQLSVGKGSGAALPELHVRNRIQSAFSPELLHGRGARLHHVSPFEDQGAITVLRQIQGAEEAGRPGADDDRPVTQCFCPGIRERIRADRCQSYIFIFQAVDQGLIGS